VVDSANKVNESDMANELDELDEADVANEANMSDKAIVTKEVNKANDAIWAGVSVKVVDSDNEAGGVLDNQLAELEKLDEANKAV
jgi:hypothetical protein